MGKNWIAQNKEILHKTIGIVRTSEAIYYTRTE
ncbi:hypothetical protein T11_5154 [Trichinella zimbabwensis]|uniref:Uncharacterized protein n=1 Tax=Trichinella zimbabwensis TaxID=268475 RepID=A0A0V1GK41_9BILA|nr:hypothetical protein T11_378 [Trichinella zimbabwensis]KRY98556.1 hypothetical protein T11_15257 [Trichinella zimbabwensis]KRY98560.1 hypothetical protein T11_5154 [Trichinella zimbabwensis]